MRTAPRDSWIAYHKPKPLADLRLFCFPFAGGSALTYRTWVDGLHKEIEVLPVELPGRGIRLNESAFNRVTPLIDALVLNLSPYFDRPYAFFGHSMGALIAYELANRLQQTRQTQPALLLVSACRAPQLSHQNMSYYNLTDAEFLVRLGDLQGTPSEALANRQLMQLLLPTIRADFELSDTCRPSCYPALNCSVTAFGGLFDAEVQRDDLTPWSKVTRAEFRLRIFRGDHFFLNTKKEAVLASIREELCV